MRDHPGKPEHELERYPRDRMRPKNAGHVEVGG